MKCATCGPRLSRRLPEVFGLFYRTLELPGNSPLKDAHATLDAAVLSAYGFSAKRDLLEQLLILNSDVSARLGTGQDVAAPGIPLSYPDPATLVTEDCIRPA